MNRVSRSTNQFRSALNSSKTEQISFPTMFLSYKKQHLLAQGKNKYINTKAPWLKVVVASSAGDHQPT